MRGFQVTDFLDALVNPFLLTGALVTIGLTIVGLVGGFACGLVVALLRAAPRPAVQRLARGYIWFFRGTPLLIQMVMIYSGLPQVGIRFGVLTSVIVALVLNEAAYMAEIIRGGFLAVPAGQRDAAAALGLSRRQTLVKVLLPQATRIILPALGNQVNGLLKATSIASVISMEELMRRSEMVMQVKFDVLEVFAAAAVMYLVMTSLWDRIQRALERHFDPAGRVPAQAEVPAPGLEQAVLQR
ncbi:MAG: amino acid ABC transporter permease [Reyranellaceae bacterium]